jgi:hypothetical protein
LVHGFFLGDNTVGKALWSMTLLAIGLNALAAWALGAKLLFSPVAARWFMSAATVGFLVYAVSVTLVAEAFGVAAVMAVMATFFCSVRS